MRFGLTVYQGPSAGSLIEKYGAVRSPKTVTTSARQTSLCSARSGVRREVPKIAVARLRRSGWVGYGKER
jgi:hypothetical protein